MIIICRVLRQDVLLLLIEILGIEYVLMVMVRDVRFGPKVG